MSVTLLQAVNALGWSLVHFLWQGLLIAALLEVALAALRERSAAARYVVRCVALGAMGLAPLVTFAVLLGADSAPLVFEPALAALLPRFEPGAHGMERALPWVVLAWSLGASALGARLGLGCRRIARLRAHAGGRTLPADTLQVFERIARCLRVRATARVVDSVRLAAPAVVGWLRPVVLFPAHVLTGLSPDQIECLIVHELAHVRRHDFLVNVLQSVIEAALFYHPAVWWVSAGIRTEREFCCDDVALRLTRNGVSYARALTTLESWRGAAGLEPGVSTLGGSLMQRIQRLIDKPDVQRRSRGGIALYAFLPFLAAGTIGAAAMGWTADEPDPTLDPLATPTAQAAPRAVGAAGVDDLAERVRAIRESIRALSNEASQAALEKELAALEERVSAALESLATPPAQARPTAPTPPGGAWRTYRWSVGDGRFGEAQPGASARFRGRFERPVPRRPAPAAEAAPAPPAPPAPAAPVAPWSRMRWTVDIEWGQTAAEAPAPSGSGTGEPGPAPGGGHSWDWKGEPGSFDFGIGVFEPGAFEFPAFDPAEFEPGAFEFQGIEPGAFEFQGFEPGAFEFQGFEPGAFEFQGFEPGAFEFQGTEPGAFEFQGFEPGAFDFQKFDPGAFEPGEWIERFGDDAGEPPGEEPAPEPEPEPSREAAPVALVLATLLDGF